MIGHNPNHRSRRAPIAKWLALLVVALAAGCSDDDSGPKAPTPTVTVTRTATPAPTGTATPVPTPNAGANAACEKLAGCQQCFSNSTGQCISTADCAARLAADVAICINAASGCPPDMLGDCLFPGCDGTDPTGECE